MASYSVPGPVTARIDVEVGDIRVAAGPPGEAAVEVSPTDPASPDDRRAAEATRVTCSGGRLDVAGPRSGALPFGRRHGSVQVSAVVPARSALEASTALGHVVAEGVLGAVAARTSAGDIRVGDAASADLRTAMGTVTAGGVAGDARCSTASGAVRVERVGGRAEVRNSNGDTCIGTTGTEARVKAANGGITVAHAHGDLVLTTANGDLRVGCARRGSVQLRTSMGSIEVGIPEGTAALLDLKTSFGAVRNDLAATASPAAGEETVEVVAETRAGRIDVLRAPADGAPADGGPLSHDA